MLPYRQAKRTADGLLEALAPQCERIEIAGSIRRQKGTVKDIELVAIPKTRESGQSDLFGGAGKVIVHNLLHGHITDTSESFTRLVPVAPGTDAPHPKADPLSIAMDPKWSQKGTNQSLYWRLWVPLRRVFVDIFLATPETWGPKFTIRTGSSKFSAALVQHWTKINGGHFHENRIHPKSRRSDAVTWHGGTPLGAPLDAPEEEDVFRVCGIQWVPPEGRHGPQNIIPAKAEP